MKNEKLSILFVIKLTKENKQGLCPINYRITYQGLRKENATGKFVNPLSWNAKAQAAIPKSTGSVALNAQLRLIEQGLNKAYLLLQLEGEEFNVEDIYHRYIGKPNEGKEYVVSYLNKHLLKIEKLIIGLELQC